MTARARHHLVLVPGFAAFDMLGPLEYYDGVVELFRAREPGQPAHIVHTLEGIPTASVETRARALTHWLVDNIDRASIQGDDRIHLIGHSTGGLDIRQLVRELADRREEPLFSPVPITGGDVLSRIRSVQFISTPHRGTNLARVIYQLMPLPQLLVRAAFVAVHRAGPHLTVAAAKGLRRLVPPHRAPNLGNAALDTLCAAAALGDGFERAQARRVFYSLLRWLNEMATDFSAVADLHPQVSGARAKCCSPIARSGDVDEIALYDGIATRSIVTVASAGDARSSDSDLDLFAVLDRILRRAPPEALGEPCTLRLLGAPDGRAAIDRGDHDGIVNSVSMVWPDAACSRLVRADHGDIIGHHGGGNGRSTYDLLPSETPFDQGHFDAVWRDVRRFAIG